MENKQVEPDGRKTRTAWREVALPREHGGWSLTAEPVLLGLIVTWSWAGLALGLAAMLAFVARTPLKVVLVDRHRDRQLQRTQLATRIAAVEVTIVAALAAAAWLGAKAPFWAPLAIAAPLIAIELWYDMRSRSRRLIPELAGTVGIGSVAAAIALADGADAKLAIGLWLVVAARSLASIPYVRSQILRAKQQPSPSWPSDAAQALAVGVAFVGWVADAVPIAALVVIAVIAVADVVKLRLAPRRALVIGIQQMAIGFVVVFTTAIAVLTG